MFDKTLAEITAQDINNLITNQVTEGQNLEFKREAWDRKDEGVREMLRDISAMANGYGGYIIVGIEEEKQTGRALQLVGVPNAEEERDRIMACCLATLHPRIIGFGIRTLEFEKGKNIILIKVPDSLNLHQITFGGLYQFWKRHDRQKNRMSVDEIKDAILKNSSGTEQAEKLLAKRKAAVEKTGGSKMLLCAVPLKLENELFKIDNSQLRELLRHSNNERRDGWHFNFPYSQTAPSINGLKVSSDKIQYLELYRNGYFEGMVEIAEGRNIETADVRDEGGKVVKQERFRNIAIIEYVYSFIKRLKEISQLLGYESPYTIQVTLFGINGVVLPQFHHRSIGFNQTRPWSEINLELPPLTFENISPEIIAKELTDRIWQAFGYEHEPYFKNGQFDFK